ncbi:polymeric immunoglobulin receptor-like [Larimichthys crocea]|uniref:polymeric immunoglobulin receptor-like n=1 Tax=Larimichthys crocea TaxID=215358 RepID=UPI000F5E6C8A|nr:polymeric immunoglobulin receptor-like [Larimichthys crocea]
MDVKLSFILMLSGLTGIHSITTVSEVSVKAGGSISIPCLYGPQYINHVKYLCKGSSWRWCLYAVRTDQQSSGKYSISDDKNRRIFTVTINDLTGKDTHYWCTVVIKRWPDERAYFHLSVTEGTPSLYVDHQGITAFIGENITINCHNGNSGAMSWCRLGDSCVTSSGSIGGTRVTIDTKNRNVFTVTMSGLRTESSGWYYCVKGDFQMPVYVTTASILSPTSEHVTHASVFASEAPTAHGGHFSSTNLSTSFSIRLTLLVLFVTVTSFIWFMVKRHMRIKLDSSATTTTTTTVKYAASFFNNIFPEKAALHHGSKEDIIAIFFCEVHPGQVASLSQGT